jgi:molecular chaperone Hsp33
VNDAADKGHLLRRFLFVGAPIRGTWVRLHPNAGELFGWDEQPPEAAALLARMLAATAMIADGLKFEGSVSLQLRGAAGLRRAVAECRQRTDLRGIARVEAAPDLEAFSAADLKGQGQLAMNLLPDDGQLYQGLIPLDEASLEENLARYFSASEQVPTWLKLAAGDDQVTGLLLQRLSDEEFASDLILDQNADQWRAVESLAATVQDNELMELPAEALLRRLFPTQTLRLLEPRALRFACTCTSERSDNALRMLSRQELLEQVAAEGRIQVTCEFCGRLYAYDRTDIHLLFEPDPPELH